MALDELDERIIRELMADGRASYTDIGGNVGLSAPAVKRRIDRLRSTGAITGFTVQVDPSALGWTTEAYVELHCRGQTSPDDILRGVSKHPEVVSASTVSGDADAVLHVLTTDVRHFEHVLERIGSEPFIARTKSVLVLSPLLRRQQAGLPGKRTTN